MLGGLDGDPDQGLHVLRPGAGTVAVRLASGGLLIGILPGRSEMSHLTITARDATTGPVLEIAGDLDYDQAPACDRP